MFLHRPNIMHERSNCCLIYSHPATHIFELTMEKSASVDWVNRKMKPAKSRKRKEKTQKHVLPICLIKFRSRSAGKPTQIASMNANSNRWKWAAMNSLFPNICGPTTSASPNNPCTTSQKNNNVRKFICRCRLSHSFPTRLELTRPNQLIYLWQHILLTVMPAAVEMCVFRN